MASMLFGKNVMDVYLQKLENRFEHRNTDWHEWLRDNWFISVYIASFYLLFLYYGRLWMSHRKAYNLQIPLFLWNAGFSVFSFCVAYRMGYEFLKYIAKFGFSESVCSGVTHPTTLFWCTCFTVSKVFELGDTAFIVLRKKPLAFLHWYHHCTTLVFTWFLNVDFAYIGIWFGVMNSSVHFVMYAYFAVNALNVKPPRFIAMFITGIQIVQMILGLTVTLWAGKNLLTGSPCTVSFGGFLFAFMMYAPHFFMFCKLFHERYLSSNTLKSNGKIH